MVLGVDVDGNTVVADLEKMPQCIVAGSTNSGKSVFLHTVIKNFLLTYRDNVALLLCDPKPIMPTSIHLVVRESLDNIVAVAFLARDIISSGKVVVVQVRVLGEVLGCQTT
jgi:hypothetical protein